MDKPRRKGRGVEGEREGFKERRLSRAKPEGATDLRPNALRAGHGIFKSAKPGCSAPTGPLPPILDGRKTGVNETATGKKAVRDGLVTAR
jgi:hypothetical protein